MNFPDFIVFDLDPNIYSGTEKKGQGARIQPERIQGDSGGGLLSERPSFRTKNQIFCRDISQNRIAYLRSNNTKVCIRSDRSFAQIIGKIIISRFPKKVTMEWNTLKRKGKVFFDYNQNSRGKTIALVYSVKPILSATVSMPVSWNKLDDIRPTDFTLKTVPDLTRGKIDGWEDVLRNKQDLAKFFQR